jgi:hypothetical protein
MQAKVKYMRGFHFFQSISWLETNPNALFCLKLRRICRDLDGNLSFFRDFQIKVKQQVINHGLDFHQSKARANT